MREKYYAQKKNNNFMLGAKREKKGQTTRGDGWLYNSISLDSF